MADATNESRSQLFFPLVWLLTTALLLVAFQTIGIPRALGDDVVDGAAVSASDFQVVAPDPLEQSVSAVLYGGMTWSVLAAEVTPTEELLGHATIDVELELTNSLVTTRLRASEREVSLVTDDGQVLPRGRFVDSGPRLAIEPGETMTVTYRVLTGHQKEPKPEDLTLVVSESNRIPALIPLAGEPPEADPPVLLAVEARPVSMADPDDSGRQIVVEPSGAMIDINAGPFRAAVGERLALVEVEVQRSTSSDSAGFLDLGFWSLSADDLSLSPIAIARTPIAGRNADEVTLLFAFPADAGRFSLHAATSDAAFALVIPGS